MVFPRLSRLRASRPATPFLRAQSGITTLEFALLTPVLLLAVMGIIEFALIMFTMASMESATAATARTGKTGFNAEGMTREETIIGSIKNRTAGLLDPDKIVITTPIYPAFNSVSQPEPCISPPSSPCPGTPGTHFHDINGNGVWDEDMGLAGLGNPGDVVVYHITYPWPIATPIINVLLGTPYPITVRAVVKNEPFNV